MFWSVTFYRDQMIILALRFIAEQPTTRELLENGKYPFFY